MTKEPLPEFQTIALQAGEQIFVNGALIEADFPCRLRLGRTASVVRGATPSPPVGLSRALATLYQGTVRLEGRPDALGQERSALVDALNKLVAQMRTVGAQTQCSRYVGALGQGDTQTALAALRALADIAQRGSGQRSPGPELPPPKLSLAANT